MTATDEGYYDDDDDDYTPDENATDVASQMATAFVTSAQPAKVVAILKTQLIQTTVRLSAICAMVSAGLTRKAVRHELR